MLDIGRMAPGGESYYLRTVAQGVEDYYLAAGEAPGRWLGRGLERFAVGGQVTGEQLQHVLGGRDPSTGEQLAAHPARQVPGFDLTFRAPKSVSIAWGLSDRPNASEFVAAHGEGAALRRRRCDQLHGRIEIAEAVTEVGGVQFWGSPKSHQTASVSLPRQVMEILAEHLDEYVAPAPDALVFTASSGTPLRHANFLSRIWRPVVELTSLPDVLQALDEDHRAAAATGNGAGLRFGRPPEGI